MDIQEVTSGAAEMQQWHKGQRTDTAVTSRKLIIFMAYACRTITGITANSTQGRRRINMNLNMHTL
jgi:hypothetical protein